MENEKKLKKCQDAEDPVFEPRNALEKWETDRIDHTWRHADPFSLTIGLVAALVFLMVAFMVVFPVARKLFETKSHFRPVHDFRIFEKYNDKPLSGAFGLLKDESALWIGTSGDGAHEYEFDTMIWRHHDVETTDNRLPGNFVREILCDGQSVWALAGIPGRRKGVDYGLARFDLSGRRWETVIGSRSFGIAGIGDILKVYEGENGVSFVCTRHSGINAYDGKTRSWRFEDPLLKNKTVNDLVVRSDVLAVATPEGIFLAEGIEGPAPRVAARLLPSRNIVQLCRSPEGEIHYLSENGEIGRLGDGRTVSVIIDEDTNFHEYKKKLLRQDGIVAVAEDENGRYWIGTQDMGVAIYDPNLHSFRGGNLETLETMVSDRVTDLENASCGVGVGTDVGLYIGNLDPDGEDLGMQVVDAGCHVHRLAADSENGALYALASLVGRDMETKSVLEVRKEEDCLGGLGNILSRTVFGDRRLPELADDRFAGAAKDAFGQIWVGTEKNGICLYDTQRRDWIRHRDIFLENPELTLEKIRYLNISQDGSTAIFVTGKGGVGTFVPRKIDLAQSQEKNTKGRIRTATMVREGGPALGRVEDVAFWNGSLYFASKDKGLVRYIADSHKWEIVNEKLHIENFQKDGANDVLYGLNENGQIHKIPGFENAAPIGDELVEEFRAAPKGIISKTRSGRLFSSFGERPWLILDQYANCEDFDTKNIVHASLDGRSVPPKLAWLASEKCIAAYNIEQHFWQANRLIADIRWIHSQDGYVWVCTKGGTLHCLNGFNLHSERKEERHVSEADYLQGIVVAVQSERGAEGGQRLVRFGPKGEVELASGTKFGNRNESQISKALWDERSEALFLGANGAVALYDHSQKRSWSVVKGRISGTVDKMARNRFLWLHTDTNQAVGLQIHRIQNGPLAIAPPAEPWLKALDFTAQDSQQDGSAVVLFQNGDLAQVSLPHLSRPVVEGKAAFDSMPSSRAAVCLDESAKRLYLAGGSKGLHKYQFGDDAHSWSINNGIRGDSVRYNGKLWCYGDRKLVLVHPDTMNTLGEYDLATGGPILDFQSQDGVVYKETDGSLKQVAFPAGNPRTSKAIVGKAFGNYDRRHIHLVSVHPEKPFIYAAAGPGSEGEFHLGRYAVEKHHWDRGKIDASAERLAVSGGSVWCLAKTGRLYRFPDDSDTFASAQDWKNVSALAASDGKVAIVQDGSVKKYGASEEGGDTKGFRIVAQNNSIDENDPDIRQAVVTGKDLWLGTTRGLWKYSTAIHKWKRVEGVDGFSTPFPSNPKTGKRKIMSDIEPVPGGLAVLDEDGRLALVEDGKSGSFEIARNVYRFAVFESDLFYSDDQGIFKVEKFEYQKKRVQREMAEIEAKAASGKPSSTIPEKPEIDTELLFSDGSSEIQSVACMAGRKGFLYAGGKGGKIQVYDSETHRWGVAGKLEAAASRMLVSKSSLWVEDDNASLYRFALSDFNDKKGSEFSRKPVAKKVLNWQLRNGDVWVLEQDGLYRSREDGDDPNQILGKGKCEFGGLKNVLHCFVLGDAGKLHFLTKKGEIHAYDASERSWEKMASEIETLGRGQQPVVRGRGKLRAYLKTEHAVAFLGGYGDKEVAVADMVPSEISTGQFDSASEKKPAKEKIEKIVDFDLSEKTVFAVLSDGRAFACKRGNFESPCEEADFSMGLSVEKQDIDDAVLHYETPQSDVLATEDKVLIYDRELRRWYEYRPYESLGKYVFAGGCLVLLHGSEPKALKIERNSDDFSEGRYICELSTESLVAAPPLESIREWKGKIVGLTLDGKLVPVLIDDDGAWRDNFELSLQGYLEFLRDINRGDEFSGEENEAQEDESLEEPVPIDWKIERFVVESSGTWALRVQDGLFRRSLRYEHDKDPAFRQIKPSDFPSDVPEAKRVLIELPMEPAGAGGKVDRVRLKNDRIVAVAAKGQSILYALESSKGAKNQVFRWSPSDGTVEPADENAIRQARNEQDRQRGQETKALIDAEEKTANLPGYRSKLGRDGEWDHDRFQAMAIIDDTFHIASDGGGMLFDADDKGLAFREIAPASDPYGNLRNAGWTVEDMAKGRVRFVRPRPDQWVEDYFVNGRRMDVSKEGDSLRIGHDLAKDAPLLWQGGFDWDRISDFAIDGDGTIWISHGDRMAAYGQERRLLRWHVAGSQMDDLLFDSAHLFFVSSGGVFKVRQPAADGPDWKESADDSVYVEIRENLAAGDDWRVNRQKGVASIFFRNMPAVLSGGRFVFDKVNDLLADKDSRRLLAATDGGLVDLTEDDWQLYPLGEDGTTAVEGLWPHPKGEEPIASISGKLYRLIIREKTIDLSPCQDCRKDLDRYLTTYENDTWKFYCDGNTPWSIESVPITFGRGRFGFDNVLGVVADPLIVASEDGVWAGYSQGAMGFYRHESEDLRHANRLFRSRFDRDDAYLLTGESMYKFEEKGAFRALTSEAKNKILAKESSIATDKDYENWLFPARTKSGDNDKYVFYRLLNGRCLELTFQKGRFGFDTVSDPQYIDGALHLATTDGVVIWNIGQTSSWRLQQYSNSGEFSALETEWKTWGAQKGWSVAPFRNDISQGLHGLDVIFRHRFTGETFACQDSSCSKGLTFAWENDGYRLAGGIGEKWTESESTLLDQGAGKDWTFHAKPGNGPKILFKDFSAKAKPVTFENGNFGFNKRRLLAAKADGLFVVNENGSSVYDAQGKCVHFELNTRWDPESKNVENAKDSFQAVLHDKYNPGDWWAKLKDGYLKSRDGKAWNREVPDESVKQQFRGELLMDEINGHWQFRKRENGDRVFRRLVQQQGKWVEFDVTGGRMDFDVMAKPEDKGALAFFQGNVWYVTEAGAAVAMDPEKGRILFDFREIDGPVKFEHIYEKKHQFEEGVLLAQTVWDGKKKVVAWDPESGRWSGWEAQEHDSYKVFSKTLLKNDNWLVKRPEEGGGLDVFAHSGRQPDGLYFPVSLSKLGGFLADQVHCAFLSKDVLLLGTEEGMRFFDDRLPCWTNHRMAIEGEAMAWFSDGIDPNEEQRQRKQKNMAAATRGGFVADATISDGRPWIMMNNGKVYLVRGSKNEPSPGPADDQDPFPAPRIRDENWSWHMAWKKGPGERGVEPTRVVEIHSVENPEIKRAMSKRGNFSDNIVLDFDAEDGKMLVASEFGVVLYGPGMKMERMFPGETDAPALYQDGGWYFRRDGKTRRIGKTARAVEKEDDPFCKRRQTKGPAEFFKDENGRIFLVLHGRRLPDNSLVSENGRFQVDEITRLFFFQDTFWAQSAAGIQKLERRDFGVLPVSDHFPCVLGNRVNHMEIEGAGRVFADSKSALAVDQDPFWFAARESLEKHDMELAEAIEKEIERLSIKSSDPQWDWIEDENCRYRIVHRKTGKARNIVDGRFDEDRPEEIFQTGSQIGCRTPDGRFQVLDKRSFELLGFWSGRLAGFSAPQVFREIEQADISIEEDGISIGEKIVVPPEEKIHSLVYADENPYLIGEKFVYKVKTK